MPFRTQHGHRYRSACFAAWSQQIIAMITVSIPLGLSFFFLYVVPQSSPLLAVKHVSLLRHSFHKSLQQQAETKDWQSRQCSSCQQSLLNIWGNREHENSQNKRLRGHYKNLQNLQRKCLSWLCDLKTTESTHPMTEGCEGKPECCP